MRLEEPSRTDRATARLHPHDGAMIGFRLLVALLIGVHGWYRLLDGGSPLFGEWLMSQHVPFALAVAWGVTITEIIGSVCIGIGVFVRSFAGLFIAIYLMGIALVHAPEGWFVVGAGRNGMEYSVLLIGSLLVIAIGTGNGACPQMTSTRDNKVMRRQPRL